ncbi:hypothetical protein [Catenulispora pinisilvae]|uniref:hypothetical protein n=1 Tax=Catenulispora pinisilvae TaxID=2705253 RepID=UPI0018911BC4|nr:hypothetical protein [Catenulispora pinisilvae]
MTDKTSVTERFQSDGRRFESGGSVTLIGSSRRVLALGVTAVPVAEDRSGEGFDAP